MEYNGYRQGEYIFPAPQYGVVPPAPYMPPEGSYGHPLAFQPTEPSITVPEAAVTSPRKRTGSDSASLPPAKRGRGRPRGSKKKATLMLLAVSLLPLSSAALPHDTDIREVPLEDLREVDQARLLLGEYLHTRRPVLIHDLPLPTTNPALRGAIPCRPLAPRPAPTTRPASRASAPLHPCTRPPPALSLNSSPTRPSAAHSRSDDEPSPTVLVSGRGETKRNEAGNSEGAEATAVTSPLHPLPEVVETHCNRGDEAVWCKGKGDAVVYTRDGGEGAKHSHSRLPSRSHRARPRSHPRLSPPVSPPSYPDACPPRPSQSGFSLTTLAHSASFVAFGGRPYSPTCAGSTQF
ncbi:hypothetical protein DFH08DRAFT_958878 [Mycena albidolilacea]|uniref:Uncharacterized protein n=1 Tax=Mycena albidolilacea TaxID=1033008 RepID=A0AAD7EV13_9AGAR|nr:hypothetical protein DFH08DRAFT_958878 [Mycena albidolilacea]